MYSRKKSDWYCMILTTVGLPEKYTINEVNFDNFTASLLDK